MFARARLRDAFRLQTRAAPRGLDRGYLLLLGLLFAFITELRQPLERRGRRRILSVADYAIQSLYHGLLLFVLPAYWASATLDSLNVLFLAGVVAGRS